MKLKVRVSGPKHWARWRRSIFSVEVEANNKAEARKKVREKLGQDWLIHGAYNGNS